MPTAGENPLLGSFAEAGGESRGEVKGQGQTVGAVNYTYSGHMMIYLLLICRNHTTLTELTEACTRREVDATSIESNLTKGKKNSPNKICGLKVGSKKNSVDYSVISNLKKTSTSLMSPKLFSPQMPDYS